MIDFAPFDPKVVPGKKLARPAAEDLVKKVPRRRKQLPPKEEEEASSDESSDDESSDEEEPVQTQPVAKPRRRKRLNTPPPKLVADENRPRTVQHRPRSDEAPMPRRRYDVGVDRTLGYAVVACLFAIVVLLLVLIVVLLFKKN